MTPEDQAAIEAVERILRYAKGPHAWAHVLASDLARVLALAKQEPPRWQPIETAPKDGTEVLLYCPPVMGKHFPDEMMASAVTTVGLFMRGKWALECDDDGDPYPSVPSHWQPLPPIPQPGETR